LTKVVIIRVISENSGLNCVVCQKKLFHSFSNYQTLKKLCIKFQISNFCFLIFVPQFEGFVTKSNQ